MIVPSRVFVDFAMAVGCIDHSKSCGMPIYTLCCTLLDSFRNVERTSVRGFVLYLSSVRRLGLGHISNHALTAFLKFWQPFPKSLNSYIGSVLFFPCT